MEVRNHNNLLRPTWLGVLYIQLPYSLQNTVLILEKKTNRLIVLEQKSGTIINGIFYSGLTLSDFQNHIGQLFAQGIAPAFECILGIK